MTPRPRVVVMLGHERAPVTLALGGSLWPSLSAAAIIADKKQAEYPWIEEPVGSMWTAAEPRQLSQNANPPQRRAFQGWLRPGHVRVAHCCQSSCSKPGY